MNVQAETNVIEEVSTEVQKLLYETETEEEKDQNLLLRKKQLEEIVKEHEERKKDTEEEEKKKPCFEQYLISGLATRENYLEVTNRAIFIGLLNEIRLFREELIKISLDNFGKHSEESEEFKVLQKEWWFYYRKISLLRSFALHFYDAPAPDWKQLMPERYYCGVLISKEDQVNYERAPVKTFETWIKNPPQWTGMKVVEPDKAVEA